MNQLSSEHVADILEAQAEYNFTARTSRELSFNKGDNILLSKQVRVRGEYYLTTGTHF